MKQKKYSIIGIPQEYSENATIHGISYVFSASNAVEKFIWWVIIIGVAGSFSEGGQPFRPAKI